MEYLGLLNPASGTSNLSEEEETRSVLFVGHSTRQGYTATRPFQAMRDLKGWSGSYGLNNYFRSSLIEKSFYGVDRLIDDMVDGRLARSIARV